MSEPTEIIQQHINLLGELPASQAKFRADLSKKIERIQAEAGKLGDLLDKINQLKTTNARSGRNIDAVRKAYEEDIQKLKEAAKQSEKANADKLKGIAENLSKHTSSLNEIKDATDGINLDDLEKNVKALQDALNAEVQLPVQKDPSTSSTSNPGWGAIRDNLKAAKEGTSGLPGGDEEELPEGWEAAVDQKEGSANKGRTYYYNSTTKETTWKRPTSGGRRKSRRNINMRRKGGRRTRRRRTHRRRGGFRYDMSPQEEKRSRTLRSVKSLRSKSIKKSKSRKRSQNDGKRSRTRKRRKRRKR